MKPTQVNILGKRYTIEYVNNPADVDLNKRDSLWGQIDYWTRSIRVYDKGRSAEDILETIIHEVLHGIADELKLNLRKDENHNELGILALAITDVLSRNGWIKE